MTSFEFDPLLVSVLSLPPIDNGEGYKTIDGVHHDLLIKLGDGVYDSGKTASLGLDTVRDYPDRTIIVDILYGVFSRSLVKYGIKARLIGGYRYYEQNMRVPSANTLDFNMENESARTQRIVRSIADTLVFALALNLEDDYYRMRITNMGLLISDEFENNHLLFSPVLEGDNRVLSTTIHGSIEHLCGNVEERFYGYYGKGGEFFKKILRRIFPYSDLLVRAEQRGLI